MARNSLKSVMRLIDTANETLPIEKSFLEDLKRSIEITAEKNNKKPSQTYKPSGMQCIRATYYQLIGAEPDNQRANFTNVGICNSGSDIHQRIQQAVLDMRDNGFDCEYINVADFIRQRGLKDLEIVKEPNFEKGEYETKLYHKSLNISFLCDGIIRYKNKYYILELKTESSFKFMNRTDVDPKHHNQGISYSMIFGIEDVIFVYINRDVLEMKSYMFHVTDDMKHGIIAFIEECNGYVNRLIAPPKPELPKGVCSYCSYKERCKSDKG